ncbi:hypothetical protein DBR11_09065 [Pedobacter sp. HMWF019]|uniref:DUF5013 domain-containing protein n=1 Tax=Pedobacter sp. HMWF019 TaxID=2056856 RepID=UPI000D337763|nr:DUF5013 domain-containing protein [Pedobacter sp. HMWF019]PTT00763.1 hypothetical protein DBR11_09065 [Pedobacter sp. HMWF019]
MTKNYFNGAKLVLTMLSIVFLNACKVDTLEQLGTLGQKVSLVQVTSGQLLLKTDNIVVDKPNFLVRRAFGLALSGLEENSGFSADVQLDFNDVPLGYDKLNSAECFLSASASSKDPVTTVNVPAGMPQGAFYINITKAAIDAHGGRPVAVKVVLLKTSKYTINTTAQSAYVLMNTSEFGTIKTNITDTYFKNAIFARQPGTTDRFVNLADWTANDALKKSRPTGAGYDQNVGYLGIERWSSGDSPIINGKIYQTFTLPAGNYTIDVDMKKVAADRDSYFIVNEGTAIPDANGISGALVQKGITNDYNNKILTVDFKLTASKQVSIGFLINIDQGTQKIIQASGIKMYKIENLFE